MIECGRTVPRGLIAIFSYADKTPAHTERISYEDGLRTCHPTSMQNERLLEAGCAQKIAVVRLLAMFFKIPVSLLQICF